jgi:hypothetical protein
VEQYQLTANKINEVTGTKKVENEALLLSRVSSKMYLFEEMVSKFFQKGEL